MARREKKPVHKVVMTERKRNIIQQLLQEYDIETAEDIQDALKDLLGGTIKEMMPEIEFEFFFCKKVIAPLRLTPFLQKATISPFHSLSRMGHPVFSVLFVKKYFFAKKRRSVFLERYKYFNIVFIF